MYSRVTTANLHFYFFFFFYVGMHPPHKTHLDKDPGSELQRCSLAESQRLVQGQICESCSLLIAYIVSRKASADTDLKRHAWKNRPTQWARRLCNFTDPEPHAPTYTHLTHINWPLLGPAWFQLGRRGDGFFLFFSDERNIQGELFLQSALAVGLVKRAQSNLQSSIAMHTKRRAGDREGKGEKTRSPSALQLSLLTLSAVWAI